MAGLPMISVSEGRGLARGGRGRARLVLLTFLLTFITARVVTFLIMSRRIPDLYLHLGGTHVHHLNYGILLLAAVGGYLLFGHPADRGATISSLGYGIGLALTFDEFGMWLHLGGSYWQRASFDAVIVLTAALGLLAFAPPLHSWRPRHLTTAVFTAGAGLVFYLMLLESFRYVAGVQPRLERLEQHAPR